MSSHDSPADDSREEPIWHPAQEWLEEDDELDMDYDPAHEASDVEEGSDLEPFYDELAGLGRGEGANMT